MSGPRARHVVAALASFAIGIALGLGTGWGPWPIQFTNADPANLRSSIKDDYIRMIAAAYAENRNLDLAMVRLSQLDRGTPTQAIDDLMTREGRTSATKTQLALSELSRELAKPSSARRPTIPSATTVSSLSLGSEPTPVSVPVFQLAEQTPLTCSDEPGPAHLRIYVRDAQGLDLPNIGIEIRWSNGDDTIYTGLKPEHGIGYADVTVLSGTYSVTILSAESDSPPSLVIGEAPADCGADQGSTHRGWKLVFRQK